MLLLTHIFIGFMSIVLATKLIIVPTQRGITRSLGLIGGTIASGTILVITNPAYMLRGCMTGLVYITAVTIMVKISHYRLAVQSQQNEE